MNTIVYVETLTGRPHDTSVQKATSDNEMWMQFNVMPWRLAVAMPTVWTCLLDVFQLCPVSAVNQKWFFQSVPLCPT